MLADGALVLPPPPPTRRLLEILLVGVWNSGALMNVGARGELTTHLISEVIETRRGKLDLSQSCPATLQQSPFEDQCFSSSLSVFFNWYRVTLHSFFWASVVYLICSHPPWPFLRVHCTVLNTSFWSFFSSATLSAHTVSWADLGSIP